MGAEMVGRFEKLFGAPQKAEARLRWRIVGTAWLACLEAGVTMLTGDVFSQILDADLQISPTGRALLNEIGRSRHDGISFHRRFYLGYDSA